MYHYKKLTFTFGLKNNYNIGMKMFIILGNHEL